MGRAARHGASKGEGGTRRAAQQTDRPQRNSSLPPLIVKVNACVCVCVCVCVGRGGMRVWERPSGAEERYEKSVQCAASSYKQRKEYG